MKSRPRPVGLIVLDGWGLSAATEGNAIAQARKPVMDRLYRDYPHSRLLAHGEAVGLTDDQMGNSNVGHLNLGAGRIVYQDLVRISKSIREGAFFQNPVLLKAFALAEQAGGAVHLLGLLSDGGVHSHQEHLYALLEMARRRGFTRVFVHPFLDGRDTPPTSARGYMEHLLRVMGEKGVGQVATVMGRYYAMDRDRRWERTRLAYQALVHGVGELAPDPLTALGAAYAREETDEFVKPVVIVGKSTGPREVAKGGTIGPKDTVIFFNFRADRARQITRALADPDFSAFSRGPSPLSDRPLAVASPGARAEESRTLFPLYLAGFTQYDESFPLPSAFPPQSLKNTFGEVISRAGLKQLRIAETEKYAHVTFFFNGGEETPFPGEKRLLIPSPKVATYDQRPEMSAREVTEALLGEIKKGNFDFFLLNYANPDMVGHTGVLEATVRAIEVVDQCLGQVVATVRQAGGAAMIVGDHGNAECMVDPKTGEPHTAHTSNPVPCLLVDDSRREVILRNGVLSEVAPTLLEILGLEKPGEMDRESLISISGRDLT
ncbi:MAG: 2,3-bisphosphoglycerate-independent phosphoglycerate mutase [Firmicutes bacterium]|nr:2,3-bisphosphoglycerate-independent phosphoglycerate mutase [Bacillota bacterium]MCL5039373.1 2,3-bisphosphoglycerate-independent phosphoglycerate mutase [Bacillota bacterium]